MSDTAKRKADAQVFRNAAKFCEKGKNKITIVRDAAVVYDGACDVLYSSSYPAFYRRDLRDQFYATFVDGEFFLAYQMFKEDADPEASAQQWRILALCFAAAMAETGDL